MAKVSAYWRPAAIGEALDLLERPHSVVIGGGTKVIATPAIEPLEVVDLQALHLKSIECLEGDMLLVGATSTLQELAENRHVPAAIREAARRELPSTLRSQATVGGCVMSRDRDSELLAALLVHDAVVKVMGKDGPAEIGLASLLADPSRLGRRIITGLMIDTSGSTAAARTGRTAADRPIVAAVARRTKLGEHRLALTGMAATPVLCGALEDLDPPSDFRGSKEYRRALARTLARRALEAVS